MSVSDSVGNAAVFDENVVGMINPDDVLSIYRMIL